MNINYRINKNEMVSKFRSYTESAADKKDNYNSISKDTYNITKYNILDKIRNIYYFIIENNKLDIRREYIHDDNSFKKVMNKLISRANNKIRTNSKGKIHLKAGTENNIIFYGDDNTYKEHIYINLKKQAKLVKYIVEELNEVLSNNNPEEEGKAVINSSNYNIFIEYKNPVHIINKLLENINKKIILEIFEGNFSNFDKYYFEFMKENNIDLDLAKKMIENIHSSFIDSDIPINMLNKKIQEDDPPKQIYKRFDDPGIENRREKSMDQLRGRGLTPKGGGWHNKRGELLATIGDKGEIVWKSNTTTKQSPTPYDQTRTYASNKDKINMQNQQSQDSVIDTGLSDKELEYIRKTFAHNEVDHV